MTNTIRSVVWSARVGLAVFTVLIGPGAVAAPAAAARAVTPSAQDLAFTTADIHGVNWADPRDNFVTGTVVPTGLSDTDGPRRSAAKARQILAGFQANLDANTIRLPVNYATVHGDWWPSYQAVIKAATKKHLRVVLSYWESNTSEDGKIDDLAQWRSMWRTITTTFATNRYVYFEPMNESHGYTFDQWSTLCAGWLKAYSSTSSVPRSRVIISGTGYNTDVTELGADPALDGTLMSVHDYRFFNPDDTTEAQFAAGIAAEVGPYRARTIIDEWGAPMTDGTDYNAPASSSPNVAFIDAIAQYAHDQHLGTIYWPGLRAGDGYSMEQLHGSYPNIRMTNTNASGRAKLLYSWGRGSGHSGS